MTPYAHRTRNLPPPPRVVWADLVTPKASGTRAWLDLLADEVPPRVLESEEPRLVLWSSLWTTRPDDRVVLELADASGPGRSGGTDLTFTLLAAGDPPDGSRLGHIRQRINHLLWADLRLSYGQ